jgi:hypothetical protein
VWEHTVTKPCPMCELVVQSHTILSTVREGLFPTTVGTLTVLSQDGPDEALSLEFRKRCDKQTWLGQVEALAHADIVVLRTLCDH